MSGMGWTVETVAAVDAEIEALPVKLRARLVRLMETVENVGPEALREPHVKHLDGKLREHEHRRRWPTGRIEQVGPATNREDAWNWERQQARQRFSSAS